MHTGMETLYSHQVSWSSGIFMRLNGAWRGCCERRKCQDWVILATVVPINTLLIKAVP